MAQEVADDCHHVRVQPAHLRGVQDEPVGRLVQLYRRLYGIQEFAGELLIVVERHIDGYRNPQTAD